MKWSDIGYGEPTLEQEAACAACNRASSDSTGGMHDLIWLAFLRRRFGEAARALLAGHLAVSAAEPPWKKLMD